MNSQKNILLVEDEAITAITETRDLEKYGYRVHTASSGEEAFKKIDSGSNIDLILMDIDLGRGMDGTEAAKIILKTYDIPLIFLSSHTDPAIVELTERITSYGYVVKQTGITVLDASIKMAFRLHEQKRRIETHEREAVVSNKELNATLEKLESINEELNETNEQLAESQRELIKQEEKFRLLVENLCEGVVIHAADTSIIFSNRRASEILGLSVDEISGKKAPDPAWIFIREDGTSLPLKNTLSPGSFPGKTHSAARYSE